MRDFCLFYQDSLLFLWRWSAYQNFIYQCQIQKNIFESRKQELSMDYKNYIFQTLCNSDTSHKL